MYELENKIIYEEISKTEGLLILKDVDEGVGTTYGTLIRRALLETDTGYDVIGICINDGKAVNMFCVIDNMLNTVLDMCRVIKKANFSVNRSEQFIELGYSGNTDEVKLKDLLVDGVELESKNLTVCKFDNPVDVELRVLLCKSNGAKSSEINKRRINDYSSDADKWIVFDSNHLDIITIGFNSKVELGKETVTLKIKTKNTNPKECLANCYQGIASNL